MSTVVNAFLKQAELHPDAAAVLDLQGVMTYGRMNHLSAFLAERILERIGGKGRRARIALLLPRTKDFIVFQFAVLRAGCAVVPVDAEYPRERVQSILEDVCDGNFKIVNHAVLQATCEEADLGPFPFALNEIAVLKHDISSMISIHTNIDGEYLTTYMADGLIVGTPTGSTAYSLSVGGPIVVPQGNNITLTPVAPHSLNMRPIVLCDSSELELRVQSRSGSFLVAIDGRSHSYPDNILLKIKRAPYDVKVVTSKNQNFFTTLRKKMMWGADHRG